MNQLLGLGHDWLDPYYLILFEKGWLCLQAEVGKETPEERGWDQAVVMTHTGERGL